MFEKLVGPKRSWRRRVTAVGAVVATGVAGWAAFANHTGTPTARPEMSTLTDSEPPDHRVDIFECGLRTFMDADGHRVGEINAAGGEVYRIYDPRHALLSPQEVQTVSPESSVSLGRPNLTLYVLGRTGWHGMRVTDDNLIRGAGPVTEPGPTLQEYAKMCAGEATVLPVPG
jgi:hypothetical protein